MLVLLEVKPALTAVHVFQHPTQNSISKMFIKITHTRKENDGLSRCMNVDWINFVVVILGGSIFKKEGVCVVFHALFIRLLVLLPVAFL